MNNNILMISSIVISICCLVGILLPKLIKEEDERYGVNALIIAFILGFLTSMVIVYLAK